MKKEENDMLNFISELVWQRYTSNKCLETKEMELVLEMCKEQGVIAFVLYNIMNNNAIRQEKIFLPSSYDKMAKIIALNNATIFFRVLRKQEKLVKFLESKSIEYCIIKGVTVAQNYPKPEYRKMGDIDIYISPDKFEMACREMKENGYVLHGTYSEYHTAFFDEDVEIEVHNALAGLPVGKTRNSLMFLQHIAESGEKYQVYGKEFVGPNMINNAIIQLLHMIHHIIGSGIGLRQLFDWMFFVNKYISDEVWKSKLEPICKECKLDMFARTITKTCNLFLGFENPDINWYKSADDEKCRMIIEFVFESGNLGVKKKVGESQKREYLAHDLWEYQREKKISYSVQIVFRTIYKVIKRKKSVKDVIDRILDIRRKRMLLVKLGVFSYKDSKDYAMQ